MLTRVSFRLSALVCVASLASTALAGSVGSACTERVIIDTDIASDLDDAFAVALALQSPEICILGFSTVSGDTLARAKVLDEMLGVSDNGDIPVAVGTPTTLPYSLPIGRQGRFGEHGHFPRETHPSAVDFIREQLGRFPDQITLVAIGPLTNLAALIDKDAPRFRQVKRVVMMGGSIRSGYGTPGDKVNGPVPEYNIWVDIPAAQKVFESGVPIYVLPTDSTAQLKLDEVKRDAIFSEGTPLSDSLGLLYLMWGGTTPVMFDAMAVAYIVDPTLCPVEPMRIVVDDKGVTRPEQGKPNAQVCLHSDPDAFFRFFMSRLR
jgi:inosine-uridine nucleoside N-ribohydrolase